MDSDGTGSKPPAQPTTDGEQRGSNGNPETAAGERMRYALTALARGDDGGSRDEVRAAARELVAALRAQQQAPEQALLQIKKVLGDAGVSAADMGSTEPGQSPSKEASLYRDLIAWSIRCYYEETV